MNGKHSRVLGFLDLGEIDKIFVVSEKKEKYSKTVTVVLPRDILSSDKVTQMADRVGLSHNKTVGIVSLVLKSATDVKGDSLSLKNFTILKSTSSRTRNVNRQKIAEERHKEFESKKPHHAAAHFDGKMLP